MKTYNYTIYIVENSGHSHNGVDIVILIVVCYYSLIVFDYFSFTMLCWRHCLNQQTSTLKKIIHTHLMP